jgi:hypothetical protein
MAPLLQPVAAGFRGFVMSKRLISREEYLAHLRDVVRAVVAVHGPLTVLACHEIANQAIVTVGVDNAAEYILLRGSP